MLQKSSACCTKFFFIKEKFGLEHVAIAFYVLLAGLSISGIGNPFIDKVLKTFFFQN